MILIRFVMLLVMSISTDAYAPNLMGASAARSSVRNRLSIACTTEKYSSLTVPELKTRLKARGMPVSGRKSDLIERLEGGPPEASASPRRSLLKRKILQRTKEDVPVDIGRSKGIEEGDEEDNEEGIEEGDEEGEEEEKLDLNEHEYNDPLDAYIALGGTILAENGGQSYDSDLPSGGFTQSREYEATRKHWRGDSRLKDKPDHSGKSSEELKNEIQTLIKERTRHRDIKHYREADEIRDQLRFEYEVEIYDYQGKWEGPNGMEGPTPRNK